MFNSSELSDELQALKSELSRLLNNAGDEMFDAAKSRADTLADQIKAVLNDLGETLSEQEDHAEAVIAEHPIATMASAFALVCTRWASLVRSAIVSALTPESAAASIQCWAVSAFPAASDLRTSATSCSSSCFCACRTCGSLGATARADSMKKRALSCAGSTSCPECNRSVALAR